ncbi:MAG TPA: protein kinase [Gemmatimonadaceae bacterium]|jgi:serine/threonine-protein kinase
MPRLSLTAKIFLASAGIVVVTLGIALAFTQRSATQAAEKSIALRLGSTVERVRELVTSERAQLASRARVFAESPDYRSSFEKANEAGDYFDQAQTAQEQLGARWIQLISREGVRLAKSDDPAASNDTLLASPLIRSALEGHTAEGFGVTSDSILMETVAVPIPGAGGQVIGALMAAKYVTDSIARAVGSQTRTEVLFFALDKRDEPRLAAATEDLRRASGPVLARISEKMHANSSEVRQAGSSVDSANAAPLDQLVLSGEHFVSRRAVLRSASGAPVGGFVAMRSLEQELEATGYTQVRRTLLLAGAGGLLLALLTGALTARQIVRPVTVLADASRRAAEGDYQAVIPEGGRDEIGTLASAFRRLLADLKDKQALVDFLSASTSGQTRTQMLSVTPTMKLQMGNVPMLEPGQTLGNRYEIKSVLGVGGMGMVYKANDKELGEAVAIKTLKPEMMSTNSNALERFKSEIKLARRISHRNVVRTYDLGEIGGLYYLTMEFVEGKSLKDLVKERGRLPASVVLPIAKQLCRALEVAHDEGVIHRDIKPQNMVVQADGVLKVMDFGIARLATRPKEAGHTEAGMVVGTPEYMAPEQLLGDELDARADLYAAGAVLYECLVGEVPLTADTPITLIAKVLDEEPRRPSAVQSDIPVALSDLVMWVLAKDREMRPRSAAELHARLDQVVLT